ncbi:MAG: hypothetical protein NC081_10050 [Roseburia sp.]|nr:hypothetical protein [Roseburia sp.]
MISIYLKFYDDTTFQGLDTNYNSYHRTYAGVVLDERVGVTFGSDVFTDWTEHIKDTDSILGKFK